MKLFLVSAAGILTVFGCGLAIAAEPEASPPTAQGYTPGLGEFMSAIQVRHAKLWFAGKGKNWPLAAYELDELKEAFEDVAKYQPEFNGKPIATLIDPMTAEPVVQLEKAIEVKDSAGFTRAFDKLSRGCSACHQANDHGFIVIRRPTVPPLTNQQFSPGRRP